MRKYPCSSVTTLRLPPSDRDVELTAAPATTAPDGSLTVPAMEPTGACANAVVMEKTETSHVSFCMIIPSFWPVSLGSAYRKSTSRGRVKQENHQRPVIRANGVSR